MSTRAHSSSFLNSGCWSPTKPAVFFTAGRDGTLHCYDLLSRAAATEPVARTKVSSAPLRCIRPDREGELLAVGDRDGTVTIVRLSPNLHQSAFHERAQLAELLEREAKASRSKQFLERAQIIKTQQVQAMMAAAASHASAALTNPKLNRQGSKSKGNARPNDTISSASASSATSASTSASSMMHQHHRRCYDFTIPTNDHNTAIEEVERNYHDHTIGLSMMLST